MRERVRGVGLGESVPLYVGVFLAGTFIAATELIGSSIAFTGSIVAFSLGLIATAVLAWHDHITLDSDGVRIRSAFQARLLPYAAIERARRRSRTVEVEDRWDGKTYDTVEYLELTLTTGEVLERRVHDAGAVAKRILERKHEAQIAGRRNSVLNRGHRSAQEWIVELRSRNDKGSGYRSAPKDLAKLWNIVESAWQRADDRAAAAVSLGHRASPEERKRLLRIAEEAPSPQLRIAIEQSVTEDDDEALAEAMDALAEDDGISPWARTK